MNKKERAPQQVEIKRLHRINESVSASCIRCQQPIYYCDCPDFIEDNDE